MTDDSILTSTKSILGITEEDTSFDSDITMSINAVFNTLTQLGIGPSLGFMITDKTVTWDAFLGSDINLNSVKTYMYFRVRLIFDPPQSGPAIAAMDAQIKELEWRLNVQRENVEWVSPIPPPGLEDDIFMDEIVLDGNSG